MIPRTPRSTRLTHSFPTRRSSDLKDPADLNDEVLKKELSSGIHRIISFIRQQENELLVPIYSEVQELNATTRQHARLLEKYQQQNIADGKRLDAFLPRLRSIENVLMAMQDRLLDKEDRHSVVSGTGGEVVVKWRGGHIIKE